MGCSKGMVLIVLELSQILLWSSSVMSKLPSKLSFRYTMMYCSFMMINLLWWHSAILFYFNFFKTIFFKHGHSFGKVVSIFISMSYIYSSFSSFHWMFLFWQRYTTSLSEANCDVSISYAWCDVPLPFTGSESTQH